MRGGRFFEKLYTNSQEVVIRFSLFKNLKKSTALQRHLGFPNIGSKVHRISSTATFDNFQSEHPIMWKLQNLSVNQILHESQNLTF